MEKPRNKVRKPLTAFETKSSTRHTVQFGNHRLLLRQIIPTNHQSQGVGQEQTIRMQLREILSEMVKDDHRRNTGLIIMII